MNKKLLIYLIVIAFFSLSSSVSAASLKSDVITLLKESNLDTDKQSICVEGGKKDLSYNADMRVIPASVSKLYTFDFALSKLPTDYRYTTSFIVNKNTLYINGSGDQFFVKEHLTKVMQEIAKDKKVKITEIVISPKFYFNWNQAPADVQMALFTALKANVDFPLAKRIKVTIGTTEYAGTGVKYNFASSPLIELLKQTNNWSTNIAAEALFHQMGGSVAFSTYMKDTYGVTNETVYFETGSGLRGNYTTCDLTLSVIQHLDTTLQSKGLSVTDLLSMPQVDEGVLKNRNINIDGLNAIVAKSGFVNFNHTLAGIINTTKSSAYFGIFINYPDLLETTAVKKTVEAVANELLDENKKILKNYNYTPKTTLLHDTQLKISSSK